MKYAVDDTRMTAIANAVRAKTGKTDTMTVDEIPAEVAAVYDKAIDDMWEMIQAHGTRTDWRWAFNQMSFKKALFKPKYNIAPVGDCSYMFYLTDRGTNWEPINLIEVEKNCGITFDFSQAKRMESAFQHASITGINVLDIRKSKSNYGMLWNSKVARINKIIVDENTPFDSYMFYVLDLEVCNFEGVIAKNGLDLRRCENRINHDSLMSVINCLKDYSTDTSGTVWKVTLGATNLAKLTAEEKAIATGKGWTLV